ncbi:RusA family crossover junction endodeoxyribonuclease [Sodalis glossinidius]|uniref:RusA family crossover junction endodeoxyribonuclease n=1 Tax=Sodalis glossinidius TaxID=63612 RepID=UPI0014131361|nr:RusA family crossover junction endodeoxyribonuclease [Sodalis glossinidius]
MRRYHITLPFPPSVNHYWYHAKGRHFIKEKGIQYRRSVMAEIMLLRLAVRFSGQIRVRVVANPPDRRKRDLDNLLKAPLDALQHAGVYEDDNQIIDLHIIRGEKVQGGKLDITLTLLEA